jgi:signal peptidase I
MNRLSKLPSVAAAVAFCLAGIGLLSGLQQLALAVFAVIPAAAGIGILRRRVWSAYGFALFEGAQLIVTPVLLSRTGAVSSSRFLFAMGFNAVLAILFLLTGRVLARSGATRGWSAPWIVLAVLGSVPFFFVQAFIVPSGGMEDTLLIGDRVLTRVFPPVTPSRGCILVFRYPVDPHQIFVKRVIGIPGDHIRIVDSVVYRNGAALSELYATHKFRSQGSYRDNFPSDPNLSMLQPNSPEIARLRQMFAHNVAGGELLVPPDSYFVLGDNRDNSLDSRYWGFVNKADVVGKAFLIYDSQAPGAVSDYRKRPGRIRWNRIFKWL